MSFLPDILTADTLDEMTGRIMKEFTLNWTAAQQVLAETLGFGHRAAVQFAANQGGSSRQAIANPQARAETTWFAAPENRHMVWNMLSMSMRAGRPILEAFADLKESLAVAGYGKDMEAAIDFLQEGILKSDRFLGDVFADAVAPYDKDEATRLVVLSRLGSFADTLRLLAIGGAG